MAIHSGILAWRIPQTEEPGVLQSNKELDTNEHLTLSLYHYHFQFCDILVSCFNFLPYSVFPSSPSGTWQDSLSGIAELTTSSAVIM